MNGSEVVPAVRDYLVVATIIRNAGRIMLVGQRDPSGEVGWSLPAGQVLPYEPVADAAAREVKEETGLDLRRIGVLAYTVQAIRPDHGDRTMALVFEVEASGDILVDDPDGDVMWAESVELPLALARLGALRNRVMREPAVEYLSGRAPAGTFWSYVGEHAVLTVPGPTRKE
jgi:8-oxo-dGTP diphosphatase